MMPRRPAPPLVQRLPEQYFTRILAAAAAAQARPGPRFIDLGRGNPDLPPPAHAIAALQEAAAQTATPAVHGYPPFQGLPSLREAIAARYADDHGVVLDPEREVAVVPGTKTGIMLAVLATAGESDVVLLPDPGYPDYHSGVALAGAREVALPLAAEARWQPDWDAVSDEQEALAVLNYPSNPCAVCAADGTLEAAVARAHERGSWVLHDLAYGFLAFDGRRGRSVLEVDGAREVALPLAADARWQPDWDAVAGEHEALAVLNYPSNPCAVCAADGTLEAAVARAHERGSWVLHDLAYGFLAFDGRHGRSVLEVEGARDVAVELWSPSKVHGMAGWRVGFLVGNADVVGRVRDLLDHLAAGVWVGLQRGLEAALGGERADVRERHDIYRSRRDRLVAGLRAAGAQIDEPEGSFYAWWRPPEGLGAAEILERARVGVAPGEGFGSRGAGWVRMSLALPDDDLDEAVSRIAALL